MVCVKGGKMFNKKRLRAQLEEANARIERLDKLLATLFATYDKLSKANDALKQPAKEE